MKKSIVWVLAATFVSGAVLLTACSSDDEGNGASPVVNSDQPTFSSVVKNVQSNMEAADFHELVPLVRALREGTARVDSAGGSKQRIESVLSALRKLADAFFSHSNGKNTYEKSWEFGDLGKTLLLAFNVNTAFENLDDKQVSGERKYDQSLDVRVNDTLFYRITSFTEKNTGVTSSAVANNANHKLAIAKNGETVLTIGSNRNTNAGIGDNKLSASSLSSGYVDYKNMKFSINQTKDINSFAKTLIYSKDDVETVNIKLTGENSFSFENMFKHDAVFKGQLEANMMNGLSSVKCDISNLNKFYAEGLYLAGLMLTGGTQEQCQEHADAFNGIMVSNLLAAGQNLGALTVRPILSDSTRNVYRPDIIVQMSPTDDGEKISVSEFLKMMGLNLESLLELLFK